LAARFNGFGAFEVSYRNAREGRNPKTQEPLTIPAHNAVTFTPSDALKKAVNP